MRETRRTSSRGCAAPLGRERISICCNSCRSNISRSRRRFTEASLVKALEEGHRTSTYAPTIATIQARGYVVTKRSWSPPSSG